MLSQIDLFFDYQLVATAVALKPTSYAIRLGLGVLAFGAAMNVDKVIARVIGFAWLLVTGAGLLLIGFQNGTWLDIFLGVVAIGGAGYSWWYTHH